MNDFYHKAAGKLNKLKSLDQFRTLRQPDSSGKNTVNLSSNDYLGIAARIDWEKEFIARYSANINEKPVGFSASSSRLLCGNHAAYYELEKTLSSMYQGRQALVFGSGYHVNIGILPAISTSRDLILGDKFNHASIIDGMKLSDARSKRYAHLDYEHLERLLAKSREKYDNVFIISESVFSMDGDIASLAKLVELKNKYGAILIIDEAHGVGVFGKTGCGICEEQKLVHDIDIIIGTFGKALCSVGAFAIMNEVLRDLLVNKMRPLVFTTALPPVTLQWSNFVLQKVIKMTEERKYLKKIARKLREGLSASGYITAGTSQIVPLILQKNSVALEKAAQLRGKGFGVFAIRPPTVPPGTARLRFSLNAAISEQTVDQLLGAL